MPAARQKSQTAERTMSLAAKSLSTQALGRVGHMDHVAYAKDAPHAPTRGVRSHPPRSARVLVRSCAVCCSDWLLCCVSMCSWLWLWPMQGTCTSARYRRDFVSCVPTVGLGNEASPMFLPNRRALT